MKQSEYKFGARFRNRQDMSVSSLLQYWVDFSKLVGQLLKLYIYCYTNDN